MPVPRVTRWIATAFCSLAFAFSSQSASRPAAAPAPVDPHAVIAHAGDDRTVDGGETVTLDATMSWDADGHPLTCSWTQVEGPAVVLDVTDPCEPAFVAPTPGTGGVPAENQVLAFEVGVSDGTLASTARARIFVVNPFDPGRDADAVVSNTLVKVGGAYPKGSLGYALQHAMNTPGARVTFDLPASDPGYDAVEGIWQFPHPGAGSIPDLQTLRGVTIDGFSQHLNAQARGDFANPHGPAIVIPGVILELGHSFGGPYVAERVLVRGLVQDMAVWNGLDVVLSGNYYNVHPRGHASLRAPGDQVGFASGTTTCNRLSVTGGTNIRVGGPTPAERNLIGSSCDPVAIFPRLPLTNVTFVGNYVGLDRTGSFGIGGGTPYGLRTAGYNANVLDVRIGGVTPGSRNVFAGISGGYGAQFLVDGPNNRVVVQGNYFGLNAQGTAAVPNAHGAVFNTQINHGTEPGQLAVGGAQPGAGNVMAGNTGAGIVLWRFGGPWRIGIQGNRIGTSADGLSAVPNAIGIDDAGGGVDGIVIGGPNAGEGNVISGNTGAGIDLNVVVAPKLPIRIHGNLIGVGADGVTPLGNGGSGVISRTLGGVTPHQAHIVGGVGPGEGNVIAYNARHGVNVGPVNAYGAIRGNSIFSNGRLGISLQDESEVLPLKNNTGDALEWAGNEGRNHPVLSGAELSGGLLTVHGSLETLPGLGVSIDFYANDAPDPSGKGEGQRYLGTHSFVMPASGSSVFSAAFPASGLGGSEVITATTTDERGNTSEFSGPVAFSIVDTTPPSISCPAPSSALADASGNAPIPDVRSGVSASDESSFTLAQSPGAGTSAGVGVHVITVTATDASGNSSSCSTTFEVQAPPPPPVTLDCSTAVPSVSEIWPPNHKWVEIAIGGVTTGGDPASIVITGILQDEPTNTAGDGHTEVDGAGVGTAVARVRAERSGSPKVPGNGRVYEILFTATAGQRSCTGTVLVGVPHDQGKGRPAIDDGVRYDSTVATGR